MNDGKKIIKKRLVLSKTGRLICLGFFGVIFLISSYNIINWYIDNTKVKKIMNDINSIDHVTEEKPVIIEENGNDKEVSLYSLNFDELYKLNNNVKGWLVVGGTNINYPVVQTNNNEYYLKHSFDKKYNTAGWPFIDYRNTLNGSDKNIIVYAHNRKNGDMFGTLNYAFKSSWLNDKSKQYINFTTKDKHYLYEVFSIYETNIIHDYIQVVFDENVLYEQFLQNLKNKSIHDFNIPLNENDKIITLSTCSSDNQGRMVLHAKLIYEE